MQHTIFTRVKTLEVRIGILSEDYHQSRFCSRCQEFNPVLLWVGISFLVSVGRIWKLLYHVWTKNRSFKINHIISSKNLRGLRNEFQEPFFFQNSLWQLASHLQLYSFEDFQKFPSPSSLFVFTFLGLPFMAHGWFQNALGGTIAKWSSTICLRLWIWLKPLESQLKCSWDTFSFDLLMRKYLKLELFISDGCQKASFSDLHQEYMDCMSIRLRYNGTNSS